MTVATKVLDYKHPGRPKGAKKEKYADAEKFYECPDCKSTIDDYAYQCNKCGFTTMVYEENGRINKEATYMNRSKLKRINPWTGDYV